MMHIPFHWQSPPDTIQLSATHIHVWLASLVVSEEQQQYYYSLLSIDEQQRADKFCVVLPQQRFIVARGMLRELLARYLPEQPLVFQYGEYGKPYLANEPLYFNLSHAEEQLIIAVSYASPLGIDVEYNLRRTDRQLISEHVFTQQEQQYLLRIPESQQCSAFFHCWTRKEAYIKAIGQGVFANLNTLPTTLANGQANQALVDEQQQCWKIIDLPTIDGYKMALAYLAQELVEVKCWRSKDNL